MAKANKAKLELRSLATSASQELANRIWAGQSDDVPVAERVARIVNALNVQGLDLDITLSHESERFISEAKVK